MSRRAGTPSPTDAGSPAGTSSVFWRPEWREPKPRRQGRDVAIPNARARAGAASEPLPPLAELRERGLRVLLDIAEDPQMTDACRVAAARSLVEAAREPSAGESLDLTALSDEELAARVEALGVKVQAARSPRPEPAAPALPPVGGTMNLEHTHDRTDPFPGAVHGDAGVGPRSDPQSSVMTVAADPLEELTSVASALGPDERRVLLAIARRLVLGRSAYGPLDVDHDPRGRDWRREASEEALDLSVYLACDLLRGAP